MLKKKVLIYGFGRMGLTHYAILNRILPNMRAIFIEPSLVTRLLGSQNVEAEFFQDDEFVGGDVDYSLICAPPMFHAKILERCVNRGDKSIFVEKPFGGIGDIICLEKYKGSNIKVGYTVRFNRLVRYFKSELTNCEVTRVEGYYYSNTLTKRPSGWRNSSHSGVLNEVGCHIIDLFIYIFGLVDPEITSKTQESIISDFDDVFKAQFLENGISFNIDFNWVDQSMRKPIFGLNVWCRGDILYKFDQQKLEVFRGDVLISRVTSVDLINDLPFYLRGVDFTEQMCSFIGEQREMCTVVDALVNRRLIKNLLRK